MWNSRFFSFFKSLFSNMAKYSSYAWLCALFTSLLIIQDLIILPGYLVLYCVFLLLWMSCLYLPFPGCGEVPECREMMTCHNCSLCMGNIYLSNTLQIYAALLYPLWCWSSTYIFVLKTYFNMGQNTQKQSLLWGSSQTVFWNLWSLLS